ncbi:MAG: DUF342 domain-containing protein [Phycisphaeraceae bacterium]
MSSGEVFAKDDTTGEESPYSSRVTRQIISKAEEAFSQALHDDRLSHVLREVIGDAGDLQESERRQLEEIAQLLASSDDGQGAADGALDCAGDFELTPSDDRMFLVLSVRPPVAGGDPVKAEDVLDALKQRSISLGVDMKAIRRAVDAAARGEEVQDVVVVSGRHAKHGQDAHLRRFARRSHDGPVEPLTDKDLDGDTPLLCKQGDVLMQYVPPVPGKPGHTALGEALQPPDPADIDPVAGKNVQREGNNFIAEVTGVAMFDGHSVETRKALIVHKDVTHQSDPIDFDGEVQVRGSVRSGAKVRATGNIVIAGNVEAAEIESIEGDVVLRSGVAGRHIAVIRAARDVNARFAEATSIVAGRDINLQVGSLHSRLIAHRTVHAVQGKGHIGGGVVMAGERVRAKQLGARGGVATHVTVGLSSETMKGLSQNDKLAARARQRREHCAELTGQIERAVGNPLKLSKRELNIYTKLRQLQVVCDVQLRKLTQQRQQLLAEGHRDFGGRVEVLVSIMPNVEINIGGAETDVEGAHGPITFLFDDQLGQITTRTGV